VMATRDLPTTLANSAWLNPDCAAKPYPIQEMVCRVHTDEGSSESAVPRRRIPWLPLNFPWMLPAHALEKLGPQLAASSAWIWRHPGHCRFGAAYGQEARRDNSGERVRSTCATWPEWPTYREEGAMLTRLKVRGFKNLVDLDLRLGPFTCIAGPNGVGKSNIFDAILFLGALADKTLLEAATGVRLETSSANAGRIFSRGRDGAVIREIRLEADMIVSPTVRDELDQEAVAGITSLRYTVAVRLLEGGDGTVPRLELAEEKLDYITKTDMRALLPFARNRREWLESVLKGRRTSPYISTENTPEGTFIKVHEDSGHQGRSQRRRADSLPRTVLSTINTNENPTALAARREMQSWKLLQLEPSRLRMSDEFNATPIIGPDGRHLAATLDRLLNAHGQDPVALRAAIANRLSKLIDDVRDVDIERDEKRELLTLLVSDRDGTWFRARDLSDGTLRFLALSILAIDWTWGGLVCMEEPENGIHPSRIGAMLRLLQALASDVGFPTGETNPLRQVIFNTHSPDVVGLSPDDTVLFATPTELRLPEGRFVGMSLRPLPGTWRGDKTVPPISKGEVLSFLRSLELALADDSERSEEGRPVALRPEFQQLPLPFVAEKPRH
jgi:predicted ATPase